jgi:hypothetical protein
MLHIMGTTLAFAANSRDHRVIARLYHHKKPLENLHKNGYKALTSLPPDGEQTFRKTNLQT